MWRPPASTTFSRSAAQTSRYLSRISLYRAPYSSGAFCSCSRISSARPRPPAPRVERPGRALPPPGRRGGGDGVVLAGGGDELDRAPPRDAPRARSVRRVLEDLRVRRGEPAGPPPPPLLEVGELLL